MAVYPRERELLAQFLGMTIAGSDVDRALDGEASSRRSSLSWIAFAARSGFARSSRMAAFRAFHVLQISDPKPSIEPPCGA